MPKKMNNVLTKPATNEIQEVAAEVRSVNFWQCVKFADTIKRYCEITMKKDDISPLHAMAMFHLVCSGGSSTPTQMAEMMFRSKHSVTKIVDNLEKEGFIVRDFSSKDRRVTHIKITSAGLQYLKKNQSQGDKRASQVMECLDIMDQKKLVVQTNRLCVQMTDILEKI
ncbi:MAG: MarR family transcriptional regulator [Dehalococcoidales bacterium]|jgi:DNA-binding MarR family transcriptional regulator